jgi:uncharacterized protein (TIGR00299 family) protein
MSSRLSPERGSMPRLPAAGSLAIHLDLVGGIAGDMFVAALLDALPELRERVLAELSAARPAGAALPAFSDGASGGLRASRFGAVPAAPQSCHTHALRGNAAASAVADAARAHGGTAYLTLRERLASAPLTPATRTHALALLTLLAEAEARAHGIAADDVHFHELADWDSLQDLVAAGCIAAALDGARWSASALPLGGGTVRTAHGLLPVPAPATVQLLEGYPWRDDGIAGERVTPTGAAILRHLVAPAACDGTRVGGRLTAAGCGAGTRDLPGMPNVLRALVFERVPDIAGDAVAIVEFDVDDMTGEEIAVAAERLRARPGAIDVSIGTRVGKKGRPIAEFRVLAEPRVVDALVRSCFVETSTLGLRIREERRRILVRAHIETTVDGDPVRVKIADRPGGERTAKAEHDDVAATAGLAARRQARTAGEQRALLGDDE